MTTASDHQPEPSPGHGRILDLVAADIAERAVVGRKRYGMWLQPHNGRDALIDAYQEAIDLVMYLRQAMEESSPSPTRRYRLVDEWGDPDLVVYDSVIEAAEDCVRKWPHMTHRINDADTGEVLGFVLDGKLWIPTPLE